MKFKTKLGQNYYNYIRNKWKHGKTENVEDAKLGNGNDLHVNGATGQMFWKEYEETT